MNYRNMHAEEKKTKTCWYSMKGKDLIPIVAQLISAGAEQPEPPCALVELSVFLWTKRGVSARI